MSFFVASLYLVYLISSKAHAIPLQTVGVLSFVIITNGMPVNVYGMLVNVYGTLINVRGLLTNVSALR